MAQISLLITTAPFDANIAVMGHYQRAKALLADGHKLRNAFFYLQGTYHAIPSLIKNSQGLTPYLGWLELQQQCQLRLMVCISAANQRGLCDSENAAALGQQALIVPPFEQVGLGEFFTQLHDCDQLIQL